MNFNAARLIKMVKDRPCIYDAQSQHKMPRYQRDCLKEKKFDEIAIALNLTTQMVKAKWKNLRDTYIKYLKWEVKYPNKYKRWKWSKHMRFMKPHLVSIQPHQENGRDSKDKLKNEGDDQSVSSPFEPEYKDVEFLDLDRDPSPTSGQENDEELIVPRKRESSFIKIEDISVPNLHGPRECVDNNQSYDPLELIFLGYARTIKTFSTRRQAQVKMKIAKLIIEEEVAQYEENQDRN